MIAARALLAPLLVMLAACASSVQAPSLAPRPIETRGVFADRPSASTAARVDPAFDARVAVALDAALAGEARFATALATARRLAPAAAGASNGSEAWVAAQQALTTLDAARGPAATALGDLDALRLEAAGRATPPDPTALDAAFARVGTIAAAHDADYRAIAAALP